jgi:hypothetical protein
VPDAAPVALVASRPNDHDGLTKLRPVETRVFLAGEAAARAHWLHWRESRGGTIALILGALHAASWRLGKTPRPQDIASCWALLDVEGASVPPSLVTTTGWLWLLEEPAPLPRGMAVPLLPLPATIIEASWRRYSIGQVIPEKKTRRGARR